MTADSPQNASNGAPVTPGRGPAEDEISLLDILVVFARKRGLIAGAVIACMVFGLAMAITSPAEYTSETTVVREAEDGGTTPRIGGLSALQGLGINLGGAGAGITTEAFPDILRSREVRLAVVRDTFYIRELGRSMTFVEYANREGGLGSTIKQYTIRLPWTILGALRSRTSSDQVADGGGRFLTEEEENALRAVRDVLSTSIDRENGLMTISVTTGDPVLSAGLTESYSRHLVERVRDMRTEKARSNLAFIEERFEEAQQQLQEAEAELARFLDRNRNISNAPHLENERDRLRRQVSFSEQLYSEMQTQITQAQIELQRSQPVITMVEEPVASLMPSGPRRTLIVLLSIILGLFLGVGAAFVKTAIENSENDDEERSKLEEIREAFSFSSAFRRRKKTFRPVSDYEAEQQAP